MVLRDGEQRSGVCFGDHLLDFFAENCSGNGEVCADHFGGLGLASRKYCDEDACGSWCEDWSSMLRGVRCLFACYLLAQWMVRVS